jgi:uncharacterized protein YndB with AHSA1/START domain
MNHHVTPQLFEQIITIYAPVEQVWTLLTDIESMKTWMGEPEMMLEIETDWMIGAPIIVRGFHHVPFINIGTVLKFTPPAGLAYTHLSSLSHLPDEPGSYTTLEFILAPAGCTTNLQLRASGFPTSSIFKHLKLYWSGALEIFKQHVERRLKALPVRMSSSRNVTRI